MTINTEVPVEVTLDELVVKEINREAIATLFQELEFKTLGQRLLGDDFESMSAASASADGGVELKTIETVSHHYETADTAEKRAQWIGELSKSEAVCFDTETTGLDPRSCELIGMSFCVEAHRT